MLFVVDIEIHFLWMGDEQVDLEHHHYRSFQGFICVMQVSTRLEDFIVDTLELRTHIGPCLADIFASSSIKKVHKMSWEKGVYSEWQTSLYIVRSACSLDLLKKHLSNHCCLNAGDAWGRSWYFVAAAGLWHLCLQSVWYWPGPLVCISICTCFVLFADLHKIYYKHLS